MRFFAAFIVAFAAITIASNAVAQTKPAVGLTAATAPAPSNDSAKKAEILASDRWKRVMQEFSEWLSMQVVYSPEQTEKVKAKLAAEVQKMSAAELQQFLDQWDAKLQILLGKDAAEARQWLGEYMSVMASGYQKQFLKKLGITDITKMSAAQIEESLDNIRAERMQMQQQRAAFDKTRQQNVKLAQQFHAEEETAAQQSGVGQAAQLGTYQTHYAPRKYDYRPPAPIIPFFFW